MSAVSPNEVLALVAAAIPQDCRRNVIIAGSLAAGCQLLTHDASLHVRTKDVDCVLIPRIKAVESGRRIAEELLAHGWTPRTEGAHAEPGTAETPLERLPAVRLCPPNSKEWFLELLTVPEPDRSTGKNWIRLELGSDHYGIPSFQFLPVATFQPVETDAGIFCARPSMMALANLLENPEIKPDRMSGIIEARSIKRSNKDLGRVLAISRLSTEEEILTWAGIWGEALREVFPNEWRKYARRGGDGLRILLASEEDLEQAHHTCINGLLASVPVTIEQLSIVGIRLIRDAVEPLEQQARR